MPLLAKNFHRKVIKQLIRFQLTEHRVGPSTTADTCLTTLSIDGCVFLITAGWAGTSGHWNLVPG